MTACYSLLHFLVDGLCAWGMLGRFGSFDAILIYNFCAFALQLPLGAVLDRLGGRRTPMVFAGIGCALTLIGACTSPVVLGIGNALFHVGGGVDVIRDGGRCEKLGIFVAPGALGLFFGGLLAGRALPILPILVVMGLLLIPLRGTDESVPEPTKKAPIPLILCCFSVVVLRSFVGFQVVFPWKTGALAFAAVAAVVLGKMAGGVLAARFGAKRVTAVSLTVAAVCFAFGNIPAFGLCALLCFNMTMPLTLHALWRRFPHLPGTVFGSLTLALFLGFLPSHYGIALPIGGVFGSILSLLLLWKAVEDA